jgi:hypothetical protein
MKALGDHVFNAPFIGLGQNGITVQATPEEITKRHQASLERLLESGWDRSEFPNPNVCVLNAYAAIASGKFTRYRKDGSVYGVYGVTYFLGKNPDGWRIFSFTGHSQDKLVQCND